MVSRAPEDLSPVPAEKAHNLGDFAEFLGELNAEGFEFAVIGGCAVIVYANMLGEELFSVDLDIYTTEETLAELLSWAPRKRPVLRVRTLISLAACPPGSRRRGS